MSYPVFVDPADAMQMPIDRLGMVLLGKMGDQHVRSVFLAGQRHNYDRNGVPNAFEILLRFCAAYDWLLVEGLVARFPDQDHYIVTELGFKVRSGGGLATIKAIKRIDVDLHPRIADRVRSQFLLGEYELAAFAAMREVEIRVRELANAGPRDVGVDLMKKAFKVGEGALTDATSVKGEQEATMALFWGAIGVFKNPPSHRQVDYEDPTLASEVVLLADLLLRMLDARSGTGDGES